MVSGFSACRGAFPSPEQVPALRWFGDVCDWLRVAR